MREDQISTRESSSNRRFFALGTTVLALTLAFLLIRQKAWFAENSAAVQAVSTVLLTGITLVYVLAASRQADAAERLTALAMQDHKDQFEFAPQIVLEAIQDTKALILFWKRQAKGQSHLMPDPQALTHSAIPGALPSARRISKDCAGFLLQAAARLRDAQFEMENVREAGNTQFQTRQKEAATKAELHLQTAEDLLKHAEERLAKGTSS